MFNCFLALVGLAFGALVPLGSFWPWLGALGVVGLVLTTLVSFATKARPPNSQAPEQRKSDHTRAENCGSDRTNCAGRFGWGVVFDF